MVGRPQLNFFNNGLWLLSNFAANIWFIQYQGFGILGAALGALLASGLVNGVRLYQIYYFYDIKPFGISQLKPIVSALGASLASWLASTAVASVLWSMVAAPLVFAPVYLVLLRLMGVEPEDRVLIDRAGNFLRRWTRST
jgi:O-antigen/teichoic acid export membrane protein